MTDIDLRTLVHGHRWFHQIDLGDGLITPGAGDIANLTAQADAYFRDDLIRGKSFLDVGCWDGFNSFDAWRRGATRVLATDHFVWSESMLAWGDRRNIQMAKRILGATEVEVQDIDLPDLTQERVGTFDVVLFAGVFYHLKHPFKALEDIAKLATECLIIETALDGLDIDRPAMVFYPGRELNNDPTNWWGPNPACVTAMLKDVGFKRVDYAPSPALPSRGIFHAWR